MSSINFSSWDIDLIQNIYNIKNNLEKNENISNKSLHNFGACSSCGCLCVIVKNEICGDCVSESENNF